MVATGPQLQEVHRTAQAPRTRLYVLPHEIFFQPGVPVRDYSLRLRNVPLEGPGRYAIRLRMLQPRRVLTVKRGVSRAACMFIP